MENRLTQVFDVDSVAKVLVLCIVTIGWYLIYKLYRFSIQINTHTELKISRLFIAITILLFTISFASLIHVLANWHDVGVVNRTIGIHIVATLFDVSWIIMVRNRIHLIAGSKKGDALWLNPLITSIFHVIYMQYKINQSRES